jgi:cysteine protease ATG4
MSKTSRTLFSVADEPPTWGDIDSDDMGLESVSEPDMESVPDDQDDFFDTQTGESRSVRSSAADSHYERPAPKNPESSPPVRRGESELSTTDESMEVITPGPRHSARFEMSAGSAKDTGLDDDDDDWVDPTPPPADVRQIPRAENGAPISLSISATPSPDLVPMPPSALRASESPSSSEGRYGQDSPTGTGRYYGRSREGQDRYPFPAGEAEEEPTRYSKSSSKPPQLRNVRARDGGRTKSGGVRGLVGAEGTGDDF